jgi:hypothetical protein
VFNKFAAELFTAIVLATPVDTGRARSGWRLKRIADQVSVKWRITNNVYYIIFLEYGSSKQAPLGMVRVNLDRFRKKVEAATKKILKG